MMHFTLLNNMLVSHAVFWSCPSVTFHVIFVYLCIFALFFFYLFCLFTYFHFFPVFTCKYILTLKKAKAESALSLIYSCTVNGLIPLYIYIYIYIPIYCFT